MTNKEFCKIVTQVEGEEIDNIKQITYRRFDGESLKEWLETAIEVMSCCVTSFGEEIPVIEVKQKDREEAFNIEAEQLGSYRCPSWERCKNICEECAFVNGISTT